MPASSTHTIEVVVIDAPCVVKVVPYDAGLEVSYN